MFNAGLDVKYILPLSTRSFGGAVIIVATSELTTVSSSITLLAPATKLCPPQINQEPGGVKNIAKLSPECDGGGFKMALCNLSW